MNRFCIDTGKVPGTKKDWGNVKSLFAGTSIGSETGFSFGSIVYDKPHYSGVHDDHEIIYILAGRGRARIGTEEVDFREDFLLIIPAGTEHSISHITEGPVEATLIHFN
jgi:mannose-6-phosphate isomerase-like protein (cupin superfamily)